MDYTITMGRMKDILLETRAEREARFAEDLKEISEFSEEERKRVSEIFLESTERLRSRDTKAIQRCVQRPQ
jgi:hypothetical protein